MNICIYVFFLKMATNQSKIMNFYQYSTNEVKLIKGSAQKFKFETFQPDSICLFCFSPSGSQPGFIQLHFFIYWLK